MPQMNADFSDVQVLEPLPKDIYLISCCELESNIGPDGKIIKKKDTNTSNPMLTLTWQVLEGPQAGKKIPYCGVMLGGITKDNKPMPLFTLMQLLEATETSWQCLKCGVSGPRDFYIGKGESDGCEKGKYFCPDCKAPAAISYDYDHFRGASCRGVVDTEKILNSDKEKNVIKKYIKKS